jgi:hypothetical protein
MKNQMLWAFCLAVLLAASPVAALTVDDVMGLTRAGASDAVILAKIDADATVFHLTVQEILDLKAAGVSDDVITYMINTGKLDTSGSTENAPPVEEQPQAAQPENDAENYDGGGQVGLGVYGGPGGVGFGVSFGYYYPYWPGYSYGYYYDPFWWPSWPYYYSYWPPYPYYHSYYDPWYACGGGYYHDYYDGCYDNYYHDGYGDSYRVDKGRNVGSRGPASPVDRVVKSPDAPTTSRIQSRETVRLRDPNPDMAQATPTVIRGKLTRPGAPDPQKVSLNSGSRNQLRTQPGKAQMVTRSTGRNQVRVQPGRTVMRSYPGSRSQAGPAPAPSRQVTRSGRGGSYYQGGAAHSAPPSRGGYSYGRGGGSSPSMGSRGGGSRGSYGGGGGGHSGGRSGKH